MARQEDADGCLMREGDLEAQTRRFVTCMISQLLQRLVSACAGTSSVSNIHVMVFGTCAWTLAPTVSMHRTGKGFSSSAHVKARFGVDLAGKPSWDRLGIKSRFE